MAELWELCAAVLTIWAAGLILPALAFTAYLSSEKRTAPSFPINV